MQIHDFVPQSIRDKQHRSPGSFECPRQSNRALPSKCRKRLALRRDALNWKEYGISISLHP